MNARYRYPFPPYPNGWYLIRESAALAPGDVIPLRYFGRDLVLFRGASGQPVMLDAHCPHMGAHLGYGGVVEGDGIRCPFHNWLFGLDGKCIDVPYGRDRRPPRAGTGCWSLHETSGLILAHYDADGQPPSWHMAECPEWSWDGWVGYETAEWRINMHTQELAENIPDTAHFLYVHSLPAQPEAEVTTDGHIYRQRTITRVGDDEQVFTQDAYGLGLVWLRQRGERRLEYTFLTATTPIDEESVHLRVLFVVNEGAGATAVSDASRTALAVVIDNIARDIPIWEHKVYRERPPLVRGDGPIPLIRHWARQFYPDTSNSDTANSVAGRQNLSSLGAELSR